MIKKMERAMLQCEEIFKDWHSTTTPLIERKKFMFFIKFPLYIDIISDMADNYKTIESYMSAAALLEDCGLFEEAIECKAMAGNQDQALILYNKLSKERKNSPKMLCILGDVKKDISCYEKALEFSGG